MILIADSGSTNTDWGYSDGNSRIAKFTTSGINPFFRNPDDISEELKKDLIPKIPGKIKKIFFYGAGVINKKIGSVLENALSGVFPDADLEIESDLLGAARATLQNKKGIACILGTGSNSCLYDGEKIITHVPPLGYILGDEGSGTVLGRKLLSDYLKNIMPDELVTHFREKSPMDYSEFMDNVYRNENVRKFLAGFVPFLKENIEEDYCQMLVEGAFTEFVERNIIHYPNYTNLPVCFVGSVGFVFQEQLVRVMKKEDLKTGVILKEPLENLIDYHLKYSRS